MDALIVSNVVLWILVVGLALVVFALTRQIGVLHERVSPAGALTLSGGVKSGETPPALSLTTLDESVLKLDSFAANGRGVLVFFLSPTCPLCRSLLPVVITFPKASGPVSAITPVNTLSSSSAKMAVAADPPVVYALATHITRTRIASELRQQLMGSSATVGELPGTPRAELMQVGEGWRAVVWPFATERDADKARHLLAERGIRTELLKF